VFLSSQFLLTVKIQVQTMTVKWLIYLRHNFWMIVDKRSFSHHVHLSRGLDIDRRHWGCKIMGAAILFPKFLQATMHLMVLLEKKIATHCLLSSLSRPLHLMYLSMPLLTQPTFKPNLNSSLSGSESKGQRWNNTLDKRIRVLSRVRSCASGVMFWSILN